MSDKAYVYGESNGAAYIDDHGDRGGSVDRRTHWDSRIEVSAIAGTVQVGIVPPSDASTDDQGVWDTDDGQFLTLSRDGINRLISALREARVAIHGVDQ